MSKDKTIEELHEEERAAWVVLDDAWVIVRAEREKAVALAVAEKAKDMAAELWEKALDAHTRAIRKADKKARLVKVKS